MATLFAIFKALAEIKALADYVNQFASAVTQWYIQKQKAETLSLIADAAALAARASTDEERYQASEKWRLALSRNRVS